MRIITLFTLLLSSNLLFAQCNKDSLRKYVVKISTQTFARNPKHIDYLNKTADYIYKSFASYSDNTFYQKYEFNKVVFKNVLVSFGPSNAHRIIVGAHYDVFGEAPGADNNASGVAALIELARLFQKVEKILKYRIDLVAYTLEEPPYTNTNQMGSNIHAKSLQENQVLVAGMINLKGIGFFLDVPNTQRYPFLYQKLFCTKTGDFISILQSNGSGTFGSVMKNLCKQYATGISVQHYRPAIPFPILNDGDHKNYRDMGYPSILISNTLSYRNKYYHYDTDTYETLDYFRMSKVVDMVYQAIIHYK